MSQTKRDKAIQFKMPEKWYRDFKAQTALSGSTPSATARLLCEQWLGKKLQTNSK